MVRTYLLRSRDVAIGLLASFLLGYVVGGSLGRVPAPSSPPPTPVGEYEERGPPTKQELGQAGWTLLHTLAANYPEQPSARQRARGEQLMRVLGDFYPCPVCAAHLRQHIAQHPVDASSRAAFSLWMCEAHNEVNVRNGKERFYCDLGVLDHRWKDCGCDHGANATSPAPTRRKAGVERLELGLRALV